MDNIENSLIEEARKHVTLVLKHELSDKCLFHTINHTLEVLSNAEIIGRYCDVGEADLNVLRLCALFHDIGYVDSYDDHEIYSARRAVDYLRAKEVDELAIEQVERAILATKMPQSPQDKISRILCDADLMNLSFDDYFEQVDLMRMEWDKVGKAKLNRHQFYLNTLDFFQKHEYHSKYGKQILQPKKEKNERRIKSKIILSER